MKHWIMVAALVSSSSFALPTMDDVDRSMAEQNPAKAKVQLQEVLKVQPDSYNANRYMVEVIRVENATNGVSDPMLTFYKNKVNRLEDECHERNAKTAASIWFGLWGGILAIGGSGFLIHRRYERKAQRKVYENDKRLMISDIQHLKGRIKILLLRHDLSDLETSHLEDADQELSEMLKVLLDQTLDESDVAWEDIQKNYQATKRFIDREF